jgi:PAS domain-containing protein
MQLHRNSAGNKPDQTLDHERFNALINNMTDAVLAIDKSGVITLSNSVALDLLDANSLTGKNLRGVLRLLDKAGRPVDIGGLIAIGGSSIATAVPLTFFSAYRR